jgi:DNA-binding NarL/FixJ family response regulator
MKRITVLLAEDHTIVRGGFRKLLDLDNRDAFSRI